MYRVLLFTSTRIINRSELFSSSMTGGLMILKERRIYYSLVLISAVTLCLISANVHAKEVKGWIVSGSGQGIVEGQKYSLYNTDQRLYLQEQDRWGANLGWTDKQNMFMKVQRITPGSGPIKCGELVGVFIEKEWMIHERQDYGINVSTRTKLDPNNAAHKWQFTNCKAQGDMVPLNTPIGLFSMNAGDSMIGCKRVAGVNACWADDVMTFKGKNYRKADAGKILGAAVDLLPIPDVLLEGAKAINLLPREIEKPEKPFPSQEDLIAEKLAENELTSRGVDPPTGGN
jgi:hypothetical protein